MTPKHVDAAWREIYGHLKAGWGSLMGDDAARSAGRREAMIARMQKRYGMTREEASEHASKWMREPGVLDDWNDTRSILDM